ncbi:cytochrome c biogenesis protein [Horticoccus sp. 23ND18S-11]|uniref:cytochrome c biogenesis protein n=1 Tax=Horticoccus sp. 23ND18S-11 TaxID=3391832 RepID=UPI0039C96354
MKKLIPLLTLILAIGFVGNKARTPKNPGAFDVVGFSQLPVLVNGRLKPLDTVARSSLLQLQGRQTVTMPNGDKITPIEWLLDVMFKPDLADAYQTFEVVNPDVLALFDLKMEDGQGEKRFSLRQLQPKIGELQRQAQLAGPVEAAIRTPFQRAVIQLYGNLVHYQRLRHALVSPGSADFLGDLLKLQDNVTAGVAAVRAKQAGQPHDEAAAAAMTEIGERFVIMAESTNFLVIPPDADVTDPTAWKPAGAALLDTFRTGRVNAAALAYAGFAHGWKNNKPDQFNKLIELFRADLVKRFEPQLKKCTTEVRFNAAQPFYSSMTLYALAFFLAIFSWLVWPETLGRAAFWLTAVAWVAATVGIATRMWLEGRPPVTNLYSSALFVGWGSAGLCLILESFFKNAIGSAAAGVVGFATLLIAHHLSLTGDTLEMMRAVLDSNFWLATHVIVVTAGYSATFLAGFLALIYIFRGMFTRTLDKVTADSLTRMVYGIVCFATLASFVGTILGGIWADQSWGRFWGWDPKENGALIIVIWNAIILHARWGGLIKQRGLMCLAVGGNIATAWSWFGTNMLGVGLHSYGFTDAAFVALTSFAISQVAIIALANLPLSKWRSFASSASTASVLRKEPAPAGSR